MFVCVFLNGQLKGKVTKIKSNQIEFIPSSKCLFIAITDYGDSHSFCSAKSSASRSDFVSRIRSLNSSTFIAHIQAPKI